MPKHVVQVDFDSQRDPMLVITVSGTAGPWATLATLMEAVGATANACQEHGITHEDGKPLNVYLQEYLDAALKHYDESRAVAEGCAED